MDRPDRTQDPDAGARLDLGSATGTPRWAKVFWTIALLAVVLFVAVFVTKGPHRPGMDHGGGHRPAPAVTERRPHPGDAGS